MDFFENIIKVLNENKSFENVYEEYAVRVSVIPEFGLRTIAFTSCKKSTSYFSFNAFYNKASDAYISKSYFINDDSSRYNYILFHDYLNDTIEYKNNETHHKISTDEEVLFGYHVIEPELYHALTNIKKLEGTDIMRFKICMNDKENTDHLNEILQQVIKDMQNV